LYDLYLFLYYNSNRTRCVDTIGDSYEGRPIFGIVISEEENDKPQVYIEGGIHARYYYYRN